MPKISNTESNVCLKLNLVKNDSMDFVKSRPDFMNWIPFDLELRIEGEVLKHHKDVSTTFSIRELKFLIQQLNEAVRIKTEGKFLNEQLEYVSSENLFELTLHETNEENLVELELWFNMGSLTNGKSFGFSKGYRFVSDIESLASFVNDLKIQFKSLCSAVGQGR